MRRQIFRQMKQKAACKVARRSLCGIALYHVHTLCIVAYTQKISDRAGGMRAGSVYRETLHKLYAAAHRIYYTTFHLELLWFSRNSQKYFPVQEIVWVTVRDACGIVVPEKEAQFMREPEQIASLEKGGEPAKLVEGYFVNLLLAMSGFTKKSLRHFVPPPFSREADKSGSLSKNSLPFRGGGPPQAVEGFC